MFKLNQKGGVELFLILGVALVSLIMVGSIDTKSTVGLTNESPQPVSVDLSKTSVDSTSKNLQIGTFTGTPVTPPPAPAPVPGPTAPPSSPGPTAPPPTGSTPPPSTYTPTCSSNGVAGECGYDCYLPKTDSCTCPPAEDLTVVCHFDSSSDCSNGTWLPNGISYVGDPHNCIINSKSPGYSADLSNPNCDSKDCYGKPVIYLYPTVTTNVNVKLTIPGYVYKSDPLYPSSGWQNVEAHPDGSLIYQGNNYNELYYESAVSKKVAPQTGIYIERAQLKNQLSAILYKLGLKENEKQEFFDYWMPKIGQTKSKYIFFSVLTDQEKESVDHVDIFPKPDTFIDFLVYFKPVEEKTDTKPLALPQTPPQRIGFTAVEWGGTLAE